MKDFFRSLGRRGRGVRLNQLRQECDRIADQLAESEISLTQATAELRRLRAANDRAAEEVARLTLAYEGARHQLEARDVMLDELEDELERWRSGSPRQAGAVPA